MGTDPSELNNPEQNGLVWHYQLLWVVAGVSLFLNLTLIGSLLVLRNRVGQALAATITVLDKVDLDAVDFTVSIDETLPIETSVEFDETFIVPIDTTIPIDTSIPFEETVVVPINTVIPVNTTVSVPISIPFAGTVNIIDIPISTQIPVNLTVEVPISKEVPIQLEIPVNLEVEIPIKRQIPIVAEVPVQFDLPVSVPLTGTPIESILHAARDALEELAAAVGL